MSPIDWWTDHGTKLLGLIGGTISAIAAVDGIIPPAHLKYYMLAISLTTFWRGFVNSNANIVNQGPTK